MKHEEPVGIRLAKGDRGQFLGRLNKARQVWASYPDKRDLADSERLSLILVLIDLQMSYMIDIGMDCEKGGTDDYVAYLCLLLSVAATGYRGATYPEILGPRNLQGFNLEVVREEI